ncbi:helix-turn-helix transcriptional regulator [Serratia fonticola]|uniref:helix-turn-helix transcriptional regulator n=1 Tax=Serratia fonticola TaxID=47917 RepID=UPI003AAB422F
MNNVKHIRRQLKLTQGQLAQLVGSTQGAISHYETGRRTPSLDVSRDIVKAFATSGVTASVDEVFPAPEPANESARA